MSKENCKLPNIWVPGTMEPFTKGYCTTVKEIINVGKKDCEHPNVWIPGTKQPFTKGKCAVPNEKKASPKASPKQISKSISITQPKISSPKQFTPPHILKQQIDYINKSSDEVKDAIKYVFTTKNQQLIAQDNINDDLQKNLNIVTKVFKDIPKTSQNVVVYKNFNKKITTDFVSATYTTTHLKQPIVKQYQLCIIIPASSSVIPYYDKNGLRVVIAKNTNFNFDKYNEATKVSTFAMSSTKKMSSPVKDSSNSIEKQLIKQVLDFSFIEKSDYKLQIDYVNNLNQEEMEALTEILEYDQDNFNISTLSNKEKNYVKIIDELFANTYTLEKPIEGYVGKYEWKDEPTGYKKISLLKNSIKVIIPKGAKVLFNLENNNIFLPRDSKFKKLKKDVYEYIVPKKLPILEVDKQKTSIMVSPQSQIKKQLNFTKSLTYTQKMALKSYFNNDGLYYNLLTENSGYDLDDDEKHVIDTLDNLFKSVPPLETDYESYVLVDMKYFKPTPTYRQISWTKQPTETRIIIPKGSHVLFLNDDDDFGSYLFPRNSNFVVQGDKIIYKEKLPLPILESNPQQVLGGVSSKIHKIHHSKSAIYVDQEYSNILKLQIEYMKKLDKKTIDALVYYTDNGYTLINNALNSGNVNSQKLETYINLIDDAFKNAPPTTQSLILYRGIKSQTKITKDFVNKAYVSTSSNKNTSLGFSGQQGYPCCFFEFTIPKGSRVLPLMFLSMFKGEMEILLARDSEFHVVKHSFTPKANTVIAKYIETIDKLKPVGVKQSTKPPQLEKQPSFIAKTLEQQVQSGKKPCKPHPAYGTDKYICNDNTGKWVLKTGAIGKKLLKTQEKISPKQQPKPKSPVKKPKSLVKSTTKSSSKKVYTKEQMYDKFKETFKDDLIGFIGKDKPKFRVATSGGYGVKTTLEEKHGIFGKIITKDIDLTVSVYNSSMNAYECYQYLLNKVKQFIKDSGDAKNFKIEVLHMYNSFVPIFKYTRYYIIMIEYKKDEFIDLAITDMKITDSMIDIPLSQNVGLPIKTEEEYLKEFLTFVYMENVPGVNDQVYYKRNPIVGKLPAKGQKDILNSKLLCDKVKKATYKGYCKLLKEITIEKLKGMPKGVRDAYFKSLQTITKEF